MTQEKELPITCQRCKKSSEEISKMMGSPFNQCDFCSQLCADCHKKEKPKQDTLPADKAAPEPVKACQHLHTYHTGGFHFSAGDVWDDIEEVCIDCGEVLSK